MVQQNPNVIRLMDWLDSTMEVLDEKIQEGTVRSNANYLSFFEDKSEELYRLHYMYKCLNDLRSNIRKPETPQNTYSEEGMPVWINCWSRTSLPEVQAR